MWLVDSHAHLNDPRLAPRVPELLAAARASGVAEIINVGYDLPSSRLAVQQASEQPMLHAAVGLHPHDAKLWNAGLKDELLRLAAGPQVVAWGEIGLDYHYDNSPREVQQAVLHTQLELAKGLSLPVIIHDRDAHADVLNILRAHAPYPAGGVMHCYSSSAEMLPDFLSLGFHISFAGPITFKNARRSLEASLLVPLERLLVETDAPYLAPEPHRGQENHPAWVALVVAKLAASRGMEYAEVARTTAENAARLFRLPLRGAQ